MVLVHLSLLGALMWRRASVPSVLWFPRVEIGACLAVLPLLTWGAAGAFGGRQRGRGPERHVCGSPCADLKELIA